MGWRVHIVLNGTYAGGKWLLFVCSNAERMEFLTKVYEQGRFTSAIEGLGTGDVLYCSHPLGDLKVDEDVYSKQVRRRRHTEGGCCCYGERRGAPRFRGSRIRTTHSRSWLQLSCVCFVFVNCIGVDYGKERERGGQGRSWSEFCIFFIPFLLSLAATLPFPCKMERIYSTTFDSFHAFFFFFCRFEKLCLCARERA